MSSSETRAKTAPADLATRISAILDEDAAARVQRYFARDADGRWHYSGARFDRLSGGTTRPGVVDVLTADDLIAATALGISIDPHVSIWILEDAAHRLSGLLRAIPADVDLWNAELSDVNEDSPAEALWQLLKSRDEVGWVTAGKLLARKRPRLIPVYDRFVLEAFGSPNNLWIDLREALRESGGALVLRLQEVRAASGATDIALLRILDIATWMRAKDAEA